MHNNCGQILCKVMFIWQDYSDFCMRPTLLSPPDWSWEHLGTGRLKQYAHVLWQAVDLGHELGHPCQGLDTLPCHCALITLYTFEIWSLLCLLCVSLKEREPHEGRRLLAHIRNSNKGIAWQLSKPTQKGTLLGATCYAPAQTFGS